MAQKVSAVEKHQEVAPGPVMGAYKKPVYTQGTGPIAPVLENTEYIKAGPITFGVEFRFLYQMDAQRRMTDLVTDFGVCIHVFAGGTDNTQERLRFDCFAIKPHYHYIDWSQRRNDRLFLDTVACGDFYLWTLESLRTRLAAMLIKAGASEAARELDQREIEAALPKVANWAMILTQRAMTNWQGTVHLKGDPI